MLHLSVPGARRVATAVVLTSALAVLLAGQGGAYAMTRSDGQLASGRVPSVLDGVAAVSAKSAWAVGSTGNFGGGKTLILHWNGTGWKRVPSPAPAGGDQLYSVTATSARNAWAVGTAGRRSLILHWNGTSWRQVPSPGPAGAMLLGVTALSGRSAWAVGSYGLARSLILHWNGTRWRGVPIPRSSTALHGYLYSVAATSSHNAWAAGDTGPRTLIDQWNGSAWKRARTPRLQPDNQL